MVIVRAPMRISFGGGGTDIEAYYTGSGGFVVSAAITRYCYVVARQSIDGGVRIFSADYHLCETYSHIPPVAEPLSLPKAVIEWFAGRGLQETGVDLFLSSEVAPGTGLGSSSAMVVALISALAALTNLKLTFQETAELACLLEIERLSMPIGRQDQFASAFGGINGISFAKEGITVRPLNLLPSVTFALADRLMLFSTGQSRHSAAILRRQSIDSRTNSAVIESLHRLKALAYEIQDALETGELDTFGLLLDRSWHEKRRLSRKISNPLIDDVYQAARTAGALGGKIAGAGGGGYMLLYCPPGRQAAVRAALARFSLHELPFDFDMSGVQIMANDDEPETRERAVGGYEMYLPAKIRATG